MTVGEVARLSGVTVRTLHHYDEIGLLRATGRSHGGYRLYADDDVDRLRAILTYRELGLGLNEIADAIDRPAARSAVLREARRRIDERITRLTAIAESLDRAITADKEGITMTPEEKLSVFGDFDPSEYEREAEERWGGTDAYAQSAARTAGYSARDWETIKAEADAIYATFADLARRSAPPDGPEAVEAVDAHREHLSRWFYECTPEIHAGLGQMYVADERFRSTIDRHGEGTAGYISQAIASVYGD